MKFENFKQKVKKGIKNAILPTAISLLSVGAAGAQNTSSPETNPPKPPMKHNEGTVADTSRMSPAELAMYADDQFDNAVTALEIAKANLEAAKVQDVNDARSTPSMATTFAAEDVEKALGHLEAMRAKKESAAQLLLATAPVMQKPKN